MRSAGSRRASRAASSGPSSCLLVLLGVRHEDGPHAQQDQQAASDLRNDPAFHRDGRLRHPLHERFHDVPTVSAAPRRVSSRRPYLPPRDGPLSACRVPRFWLPSGGVSAYDARMKTGRMRFGGAAAARVDSTKPEVLKTVRTGRPAMMLPTEAH